MTETVKRSLPDWQIYRREAEWLRQLLMKWIEQHQSLLVEGQQLMVSHLVILVSFDKFEELVLPMQHRFLRWLAGL